MALIGSLQRTCRRTEAYDVLSVTSKELEAAGFLTITQRKLLYMLYSGIRSPSSSLHRGDMCLSFHHTLACHSYEPCRIIAQQTRL